MGYRRIKSLLRASVSTNECDWLTQRPFFAFKVTWIVLRNFRFWIHFGWILIKNGNFKSKNPPKKFSNFGWRLISRDRELSELSKKFESTKKFSKKKIWARALIYKTLSTNEKRDFFKIRLNGALW